MPQARIDCLEVVNASKIRGLIGPRGYLWGCLASNARPRNELIDAVGIFVEYRQDRAIAVKREARLGHRKVDGGMKLMAE